MLSKLRVCCQFKSVGHLRHDEAMEAGCREFRDPTGAL